MIDDPWIPEFEPRLLDLRQLPFKEFSDNKLLEELFFQPLLDICKFPIDSGKLCGLPILGDVDFLCYDTTAVRDIRVTELLNRSVIDPDQLKHEIVTERRNRTDSSAESSSFPKMPFVIRNLDDEDLVENFWLIMRGYGLEDVYRPEQDEEIKIPSDLAKLSSDWMYEVDPEWNRSVSGSELVDNMVGGSGPRDDLRLAEYNSSQGEKRSLDCQADRSAPVRPPGAFGSTSAGNPRRTGTPA